MKTFLKIFSVLVVLVAVVIVSAYAFSDYTVDVRTRFRVSTTIGDTAAFSAGSAGEARYTKSIYSRGTTSADYAFVNWRFDSSAQRFPKDYTPVVGALDSTAALGVLCKTDSIVVFRSDTTFWKTGKFNWFRVQHMP